MYQNGGNGAFSFIQLGLDDKTSGFPVRVCLQLVDLCSQKDHLKQSVDAFSGVCGYRHADRASAPVLGDQLVLGEFLFYTLDVGAGFINLVDGNDDLDACCLPLLPK